MISELEKRVTFATRLKFKVENVFVKRLRLGQVTNLDRHMIAPIDLNAHTPPLCASWLFDLHTFDHAILEGVSMAEVPEWVHLLLILKGSVWHQVRTRSKVDEAADSLIQPARPQQRFNSGRYHRHGLFRPGATELESDPDFYYRRAKTHGLPESPFSVLRTFSMGPSAYTGSNHPFTPIRPDPLS